MVGPLHNAQSYHIALIPLSIWLWLPSERKPHYVSFITNRAGELKANGEDGARFVPLLIIHFVFLVVTPFCILVGCFVLVCEVKMTSGSYIVALECYPLSLLTYYSACLSNFYAVASRSSSFTECLCLHSIFYFYLYYYGVVTDKEAFTPLRGVSCLTISSALRICRRFEIIFWFDTPSNT